MSDDLPLAAAPIDVLLGRECVRCGKTTMRYHTGWDSKGPICDDCWLEDADEWDRQRYEAALAEEEIERALDDAEGSHEVHDGTVSKPPARLPPHPCLALDSPPSSRLASRSPSKARWHYSGRFDMGASGRPS